MTDRELLEWAAKAAGYQIESIDVAAWAYVPDGKPDAHGERPVFLWSPLSDDGDALRLEVDLAFRIDHLYSDGPKVMVGNGDAWIMEDYAGDRHAATRRAIVRAAAEIGKQIIEREEGA